MGNYTREEILQMAEEEDVEFIRLQFTDMFGTSVRQLLCGAQNALHVLPNDRVAAVLFVFRFDL